MLKVTCSDGIDLKFLDEANLELLVEDGALTVKNIRTKEIVIRLEEGKWTNYVHVPTETTITT
jgi:hypothetical protein